MRSTGFVLPLLLLGCGQPSPDEAPGDEPPAAAPTSIAAAPTEARQAGIVPAGSQPLRAVADLVGEYRVAGIDGSEVEGNVGIAVSIDGTRLSYEPTCAGFVWDIAGEDGRFALTRAPGYGPTRQPDGSIAVCAVAVPPEFRRLGTAIDAVTAAWRTPSNSVLLEGGGRSVTLFSQ